jgi:pimeloyl-ACP methyl ester carboxylesterase
MGARVETVGFDGVRIRVRVVSEEAAAPGAPDAQGAPSVVFVHGIGMSHRSFSHVGRPLAGSHRLVAVDLPGFGGTPSPGRRLGIEGHAAVLAAALERLGLAGCSVVGQSMGTQIAVELARTRPELVSSLVLIGPVVDDRRATVVHQMAALLRDTLRETPRMNAVVIGDYLRGIPQYLRELGPMLDYPTLPRVAELDVPVLVVRGTRDPIARAAWARRVTDAARHGTLAEVGGAHHVQERSPAEVAALIGRLARGEPLETSRSTPR